MLRAILIDDDSQSLENLTAELQLHGNRLDIVGSANNIETGKTLIESKKPDVLFLDIEMGHGELIFSLFDKLDYSQYHIIFVSGHTKYALQAFDFCAVDYLSKPVTQEALERAIDRIAELPPKVNPEAISYLKNLLSNEPTPSKLGIRTGNYVEFVQLEDIIFLEGDRCYTHIYTSKEKYTASLGMSHYEDLLPSDTFFRIHKSHIINGKHIKKIKRSKTGKEIIMSNDQSLAVSKRRKQEFDDFMKGHSVNTK